MQTDILRELAAVVGDTNLLTGAARGDRSEIWGTAQPCEAYAVVCPRDTGEVAAVMKICHARRQPVVPMGGMTNLVQGAATRPADIAISFERMNDVEDLDVAGATMTVQAGVTLQEAQERAEAAGFYFPVDIGARGNCMLGGNVSTNAGGTRVIRYGMIRDSVLGLEAVLADGTIIGSMNRLLKNNSGFDLKHLFIGTEGTLGLVTRVVFRLREQPKSHNVALVACNEYREVTDLLARCRARLGNMLCGFEVMWDSYYHAVVEPGGRLPTPLAPDYRFYIIIECTGTDPGSDDELFETALGDVFAEGLVADGTVAKSGQERAAIWAIRHDVEWVVRDALVFDVSLPVVDVDRYARQVSMQVGAAAPGSKTVVFGHLGDNNIHLCVVGADRKTHSAAVQKAVYETLAPYGGAISAEHGIGLEKKRWLSISRSEAEIDLMRALKRTLDPHNILNPGKVLELD